MISKTEEGKGVTRLDLDDITTRQILLNEFTKFALKENFIREIGPEKWEGIIPISKLLEHLILSTSFKIEEKYLLLDLAELFWYEFNPKDRAYQEYRENKFAFWRTMVRATINELPTNREKLNKIRNFIRGAAHDELRTYFGKSGEFKKEYSDEYEVKMELLNKELEYYEKIVSSESLLLDSAPLKTMGMTIRWNGTQNALVDILRRLKNKVNKEGRPLIDNSYEELAIFLKEGVDCFASSTLATILTQLKRKERPQKGANRIDIDTD